jgi:dipeptidyl aminopeptidase/acylaminoacyl peptidase
MSLSDVLSRTAREADGTLRYGPGTEHVIELWRPPGNPPYRTVVVIHGGFWSARYDRTHIRPFCTELAASGFLTVALEYHRVGQDRGGWPGTFTDIADALDALPRLTSGLVNGQDTVLLGHSAGGHLALWAASRHRLAPGNPGHLRTRGVVSLAGVCDLVAAHRLGLGDGAVDRLLGGSPAQLPDRYRIADPIQLLPLEDRCVLIHGDDDDRVPVDISRRFHNRATRTGTNIKLVELPHTGHFEIIDPVTPAFQSVLDAITTVF